MNIIGIRHPQYNDMCLLWKKYRLTYEGGYDFIKEYLKTFSKREDYSEFCIRREATYCPAHAKTAVNEIKDAISERLVDVIRDGGDASYKLAIAGLNGGVDRNYSTMNGFMSCEVLPELLALGKVGVYIDRPVLPMRASRADELAAVPYLYTYRAEDILTWKHDEDNVLVSILLRETVYLEDDDTGLPKGIEARYRLLEKTAGGIRVTFYDSVGTETSSSILALSVIPFALFKIKQSLMTDIADYQIALLNLGSSDLSYAIKSNFPFYTEQYDPRDLITNLLQSGDIDDSNGDAISQGTSTEANTAKNSEVKVGIATGRKYTKGLERPGFIHPSSEPLEASMKKQKDLQTEIRELTRLSVKSLASSSGESKAEDSKAIESGLASIGAELEKGERQITKAWSQYTKSQPALIKYPGNYTLRTDAQRQAEAEQLLALMPKLPSDALKKVIARQVAEILVGHRATTDEMAKIQAEILDSAVIITDPEVIRADQEAGLVSNALASKLRGYPEGEVAQAVIDHTERLSRIAMAQSQASVANLNAARGVSDMDDGSETAADEKKKSRDTTEDDVVTDKTRGDAKNG